MNKAFSKIWIIVILVIFIAGGFFVWQRFGAQKGEVKAPEEIINPKEIVKDETTNWKTYRNEEHRFEIKYPPDYLYQENTFTPRVDMAYFFPIENKSEFGFEPEIFISVATEPQTLLFHGTFGTVSRLEAVNSTETSLISSEDITINNVAWKKDSWRLFNDLTPVTFYTKRTNTYYSISLGQREKEETLDQMLSTFKFLK